MNTKTNQVHQPDEPTHSQVQDLLPWYVVNTLQPDEQQLVRTHLQTCVACQDDLQWQLKLKTGEPVASTAPDVERALARLLPRLDAQVQPNRAKTDNNFMARLLSMFKTDGKTSTRWGTAVMAAQSAVIVGLIALIALPKQDDSNYRVLGSGERSSGNIVVVFKPETTVKDIQRIMAMNDARIIDGPTVTNAYLLNVPDTRLTQSIKELRTETGIELVESLGSGEAK
ncbi:MAG: zf-HC2 domain-containing protein [Burkholderiales bacterium]|nr:zf-HC2 domain-containing protein [Burkholderiales bacterium]MBI3726952.1 zf-HC2 domain-containing protein [Burkholderiales bacterium]